MANALTAKAGVVAKVGGKAVGDTLLATGAALLMTGVRAESRLDFVDTTPMQLDFSTWDSLGTLALKNTGDTNNLVVDGVNSFDAFPQTLLPGDVLLLHPNSGDVWIKAAAADTSYQLVAAEL